MPQTARCLRREKKARAREHLESKLNAPVKSNSQLPWTTQLNATPIASQMGNLVESSRAQNFIPPICRIVEGGPEPISRKYNQTANGIAQAQRDHFRRRRLLSRRVDNR